MQTHIVCHIFQTSNLVYGWRTTRISYRRHDLEGIGYSVLGIMMSCATTIIVVKMRQMSAIASSTSIVFVNVVTELKSRLVEHRRQHHPIIVIFMSSLHCQIICRLATVISCMSSG